jgi:hypothetical protein
LIAEGIYETFYRYESLDHIYRIALLLISLSWTYLQFSYTLHILKMRISSLATALLLPLLAIADTTSSTTTITSTATLTKTITVQKVYAVTSTYANSTTAMTATGATYLASASPTNTHPANYMGAASSLNGMYAGGASVLVMIAAALL